MSSFSKRQPASCQLQSLYMQHSLEFEFFNPPPPNLDPAQGMFTLMFLVLSSVSSFPRFWWGSLQALVDILEQLALAIVAKPSKCIVSESRRINRPSGPKIGTKGKRRSTFDQDRNISASDFQGGRTASLQSPEPIERSSTGVYSTMPDHSPDLVPHRISHSMHDHKHYAMVSNVASVSSSSPWYNYETQNYDNYGEYVAAGNSSGTDYWRMEGHSGNTQFNPSPELFELIRYNSSSAMSNRRGGSLKSKSKSRCKLDRPPSKIGGSRGLMGTSIGGWYVLVVRGTSGGSLRLSDISCLLSVELWEESLWKASCIVWPHLRNEEDRVLVVVVHNKTDKSDLDNSKRLTLAGLFLYDNISTSVSDPSFSRRLEIRSMMILGVEEILTLTRLRYRHRKTRLTRGRNRMLTCQWMGGGGYGVVPTISAVRRPRRECFLISGGAKLSVEGLCQATSVQWASETE
ncbi:hypothetical protein EV368DRAFT_67127 [Lentinula lateritia]|nr:hypothetical protein EV368DRAFT_67127 [Lentinula lateritia]